MAVLILLKFLDFEQVSVNSEIPILGQAPRKSPKLYNNKGHNQFILVMAFVV
jgi:hypothetical protein